jgi:hypothetical protein
MWVDPGLHFAPKDLRPSGNCSFRLPSRSFCLRDLHPSLTLHLTRLGAHTLVAQAMPLFLISHDVVLLAFLRNRR